MKIKEMVAGDKIVLSAYNAEFTAVSDAIEIQDDEAPGFYRIEGFLRDEAMTLTASGDVEYGKAQ